MNMFRGLLLQPTASYCPHNTLQRIEMKRLLAILLVLTTVSEAWADVKLPTIIDSGGNETTREE